LISALYIILVTHPADSYEFSVYTTYPSYFWTLIILSIFIGQICAILSTLNDITRKYWIWGFLAEVIAISLVLFLPMIRGYFIYGRGDVLTHIGYMQDIQSIGLIDGNHYPGYHLLGFFIHELTGLSYGAITMMVPAIFSLIYILYWFVLGRELMQNLTANVILVTIAALPMVVKGLFTPNSLANLLIPLVLFFMVKSLRNSNTYKECSILILLCISMIFFHPLATLMILVIFFMAHVYKNMFNSYFLSKYNNQSHLLEIIAIVGIIFLTWGTYLAMFVDTAEPLITSVLGIENTRSEFIIKSQLINSVDVDILYLVKLGMHTYGIEVILGLSTLICVLYLLYIHIMGGKPIHHRSFLFFSIICFMVFSILSIILFFTIAVFNWERVYKFALIFSLIVVSSVVAMVYRRTRSSSKIKKIILYSLILVTLAGIIYFSIFNCHLSPLMKKEHQQVTKGEYAGMCMFFENRDPSISTLEYGGDQRRFYDAMYGGHSSSVISRGTLPLDHFGYNVTHSFGSNYNSRRYFLLSEVGRGFYRNTFPEFPDRWGFTDRDFQMLELDASIIRIYSNNDFEIFLTEPSPIKNWVIAPSNG
jgi:hypothetical protein